MPDDPITAAVADPYGDPDALREYLLSDSEWDALMDELPDLDELLRDLEATFTGCRGDMPVP